jgi:hypothetical protein
MKLSKIATAAALLAMLGAGAAPAFAGEMSKMPAAAIRAAVVPTLGQVQGQLSPSWPAFGRSPAEVILQS